MLFADDSAGVVQLAVGLCAFTEEACLAELWSWHEVPEVDPYSPEIDDETAAAMLLLEATALRNHGDIARCAEVAGEAAARSTDRWIVGRAKHTGAMAALFSGDPLAAGDLWLESDQQLGGCRGRLFAAMAAAFASQLDLAFDHLSQCEIEPGSRVPVDLFTNVRLVRGEVARVADTGGARAEFEEAVDVARSHGLMFSLGIAQVPLVAILEADGDVADAALGYRELVELFLRAGTWTQIWITLRNAARLLAERAPATALLVLEAADRDAGSPALDDLASAEAQQLRAAAADRLGEDQAQRVLRRAGLASRADVVRETVGELERIA